MTAIALCFIAGAYGWLIWMLARDQLQLIRAQREITNSLDKCVKLIRMQEHELRLLRGIVERMVKDHD